jgi:hypothetical protein
MRSRTFNAVSGLGRARLPYFQPLLKGLSGYDEYGNYVSDDPSYTVFSPDGSAQTYPGVYTPGAISTPGSAGAGTVMEQSGILDFVKSLLTFAPQVVGAKQVYDINQINLERARRGQPLLTQSQLNTLQPQVNVGLAPAQMDVVRYALIGLGVYGAVKIFTGRRK